MCFFDATSYPWYASSKWGDQGGSCVSMRAPRRSEPFPPTPAAHRAPVFIFIILVSSATAFVTPLPSKLPVLRHGALARPPAAAGARRGTTAPTATLLPLDSVGQWVLPLPSPPSDMKKSCSLYARSLATIGMLAKKVRDLTGTELSVPRAGWVPTVERPSPPDDRRHASHGGRQRPCS